MIGEHWYHETIKSAVAAFGSLFNNMVIRRRDGKMLPVPISYGPRSKWLEAQKGLKREEEMFEKLLPRMSYEMVAMSYDTNRKITNKQSVIRTPDSLAHPRQRIQAPVPYNLDFTLYLETKNLNDGWQILEQILPFFTPAYVVKVRHFPADYDSDTPTPTNSYDMPIVLSSLAWGDDWTGDIADRRTVEWTLEFTTKINLWGPLSVPKIIFDSRVIIATPPAGGTIDGLSRRFTQEGLETGFVRLQENDSEALFDSDNVILHPQVTNLHTTDSDGNIVKTLRDISFL